MASHPIAPPPKDAIPDQIAVTEEELNHMLDKTKSKVFLNDNAAFLSTLMSEMNFYWTDGTEDGIDTAATDGENFWWNAYFFLWLTPETRTTVLIHELWHAGLLHMDRRGSRDPLIWNYAADIVINNGLTKDGYSFKGIEDCWRDIKYAGMAEEDVYDALIKSGITPPPGSTWGPCNPAKGGSPGSGKQQGDIVPGSNQKAGPGAKQQRIGRVIRARQAAEKMGQAGNLPGNITQIIENFIAPVIPWEQVIAEFFTDLIEEDYSWATPNRRYPDMYLPSRYQDEGRLAHIMYFLDVSGSISDRELLRFNSEVFYLKETYNPKKLTLVQFDTQIQQEKVIEEHDDFKSIKIQGRGGTCLVCVREHILKHKPTAVVIFTDLYVPPMESIEGIPIIWAVSGNPTATVPFGKLIHIEEQERNLN